MAGYRDTLNLPRTEFPMKADLPRREPERLRWWRGARPLPPAARGARAAAPVLAAARRPALLERPPPHGHRGQQDLEGRRGAQRLAAGLRRALRAGLGQPRHADRDPGRPASSASARRPPDRSRCAAAAASTPPSGWTIQREEFERLGVLGRLGASLPDHGPALRGRDPRDLRRRSPSAASSSAACARSTGARPTAPRWPRPRSSTRTIPRPRSTCASRCARDPRGALGGAAPSVAARGLDHHAVDAARQPRPDGRSRAPTTSWSRAGGRPLRSLAAARLEARGARPRAGSAARSTRRAARARPGRRRSSRARGGDDSRVVDGTPFVSLEDGTGLVHTAPGPRQGGLRGRPARRARGALPGRRGRPLHRRAPSRSSGRSVLEVNDDIIALAARARPAARRGDASPTPTRTAGAATSR